MPNKKTNKNASLRRSKRNILQINSNQVINSMHSSSMHKSKETVDEISSNDEYLNTNFNSACASRNLRLPNIDSPFKKINVMEKRFEKLSKEIEQMIDKKFKEYISEFLSAFEKSFNLIKQELHNVTERVEKLETNTVSFKTMREEIKSLKSKIKQQENRNVSCELRLNEIPYKENENLYLIFEKICNTINISVPAVKTIYRLQNLNNKNKSNSKDAVIIVKMWSPYDKNFFLKSFTSYRKEHKGFSFHLRHIGETSDNKFLVNENLTATNFKIR